jgi:mannose-6-phosphate isomerase-like protein (cupin superfamily)
MEITRFKDSRLFTAGDGSRLREILNPKKNRRFKIFYSMAWAIVHPDQKTVPHKLKYSEVYFILKGKGKMHINRKKATVKARDTVYIPPRSTQHIENIGRSDLEFLCIVSPAWDPSCEKITRK